MFGAILSVCRLFVTIVHFSTRGLLVKPVGDEISQPSQRDRWYP